MSLLKQFIQYQEERFPLKILVFTTLSSTLVSVAVTGNMASISDIIILFFSSLFFVFHIRVIDESRDAEYDKKHYPDRPVQRGSISIKELFYIDLSGLIFTLIVALLYGLPALIYALALYVFTTLAWKDFFASSFFENKPLLYHIVNSPQMVLLQLFIYSVLTKSFAISKIMWIQMFLVYINIFILEVIRKIKSSDIKAGDVYSKSMGFNKAVVFSLVLEIFAYLVFLYLLNKLTDNQPTYIIIGSGIILFSILSFIGHIFAKSKATEKLMLLSGFLTYVGLNTLLYLSVNCYGN